MSNITDINEEVKDIIKEIIIKHNLDPNSQVIYGVGSEIGDGYMSKTLSADIVGNEETINLFLKYGLGVQSHTIPLDKLYATERHFFNVIYQDYLTFAQSKGVEDALKNVPKCFGASEKNVVALENLKKRGFQMTKAKKGLNADHILATLEAMARFHAVSFAFKDQNRERYEAITGNLSYFMDAHDKMEEMLSMFLNRFIEELDAVDDKIILEQMDNIRAKGLEYFKEMDSKRNENSILTKGDCWVNNLMFSYANENKESPVDVMLVDWQTANVESVAKDLSMFFFTSAVKEDLEKLKYYLKMYHDKFSTYMKRLGSDPEKVFPFSALEEEWRQHSRFGYTMATMFLHTIIEINAGDIDVEQFHTDADSMKNAMLKKKLPTDYIKRLKDLTEFCVENNYIP